MGTVLIMAALAMAAGESDAQPADLESQVRRLVRELDSTELSAREAAEAELVELGPSALAHLPESDEGLSAEVKERLLRVRNKLQVASGQASVQASRVTVDISESPLSKLLDAIKAQTGNQVMIYDRGGEPGPDPDLTLKVENLSFWETLDRALDITDSSIFPYADDAPDSLAIVPRNEMELPRSQRPVAYAGAFRIEARRVYSEVDLGTTGRRLLKLELDAAWEPRLKPISLQHFFGEVEATDDQGAPIAASTEGIQEITPLPGEHFRELQIPLELPPRKCEKISSLKGRLMVLMAGKTETFTWDDFRKANQQQRKASAVVTLQRVKRNESIWEARVKVRFDQAGGALQSHLNWVFSNKAWMVSPEGQKIEPDTTEETGRSEEEAGMAYLFGIETQSIKGYKFVYETPGTIQPVELNYELKDLPLP